MVFKSVYICVYKMAVRIILIYSTRGASDWAEDIYNNKTTTVVLLLLIHCCSHFLFVFCVWLLFSCQFFVSKLLVAQSSGWGRENWLLILMSCDSWCSVTLPHSAMGWSAVYVCGIS